jgi:hypothetical protein
LKHQTINGPQEAILRPAPNNSDASRRTGEGLCEWSSTFRRRKVRRTKVNMCSINGTGVLIQTYVVFAMFASVTTGTFGLLAVPYIGNLKELASGQSVKSIIAIEIMAVSRGGCE